MREKEREQKSHGLQSIKVELRQESKHSIFLFALQTVSCGFVYCPLQLGRNVAGATFDVCFQQF